MFHSFLSDLENWTAKPYNEDGNIFDWFLFIGLLTCATILWTRIIRRLAD